METVTIYFQNGNSIRFECERVLVESKTEIQLFKQKSDKIPFAIFFNVAGFVSLNVNQNI